ncbi:MAG: MSMEG_4193 family putative phosphomutase [Kineosporiaceae bacterium]
MPTVLLVRHGRSTANTAGVLAGRTPGVALDETGRRQVGDLAARLTTVPFASVVTSPVQRCRETAEALVAVPGPRGRFRHRPPVLVEDRLAEVDYGEWSNGRLRDLARHPLWRTVQVQPSAVTFPGGESLRAMQARAVEAVREHDARVAADTGESAVWVAVTHGDVVKAVLADALGIHLDAFQRIVADPASVSAVRYTPARPFVLRVNDTGGDVSALVPLRRRRPRTEAVVGGGAGTP